MGDHAPKAAPAPKKPSPKLNMTVVLWIAAGAAVALAIFFAVNSPKKAGTNPQGPAAVQTGPVTRPAQAARGASDPCSTQAPQTVTAPTGTARSRWVSLPTGSCLAQSSDGRYVTYGVECLGTDGVTYADGVCKGYAAAERYYSKGSAPVEVTMTAVYRPPT